MGARWANVETRRPSCGVEGVEEWVLRCGWGVGELVFDFGHERAILNESVIVERFLPAYSEFDERQ